MSRDIYSDAFLDTTINLVSFWIIKFFIIVIQSYFNLQQAEISNFVFLFYLIKSINYHSLSFTKKDIYSVTAGEVRSYFNMVEIIAN